jgi:hypothetical protein
MWVCLDFLILYIYIYHTIYNIHDAKSLFRGENDNKAVDLTVFSDEPISDPNMNNAWWERDGKGTLND